MEELNLENKKNKKKSSWSAKKVLTTIIIAVLALLMIGGSYYIVILYQQNHDESNVYGYYNGEAIKLESNTVFANSLYSSEDYQNAAASGDWSSMINALYQAYMNQVVYTAVNQKAQEANILAPSDLVDQLIIDSGVYAGEDSTFDEEVYNATSSANKAATYNYIESIYPYNVVFTDTYSSLSSEAEADFILSLAEQARDFTYFTVEATDNIDAIAADILKNYDAAVDKYSEGATVLEGIMNNVGNSSMFYNTISTNDYTGDLAAVLTEELNNELFAAEEGFVKGPIETEDGRYLFVKVTKTNSEASLAYLSQMMYQYYSAQMVAADLQNEIVTSEKFEDNFYAKALEMMMSNQTSTEETEE